MDNRINSFSTNRNLAFGTAVFKEGGAKRFAKAFIGAKELAMSFLQAESKNVDVDVFISAEKVEVSPKKYAEELKDFLSRERSRVLFDENRSNVILTFPKEPYVDTQALQEHMRKPFENAFALSTKTQKLINEFEDFYTKDGADVNAFAKELEELAKS